MLSESSANNRSLSKKVDKVTHDDSKPPKELNKKTSQISRPKSFEEEVYPILGTPPRSKQETSLDISSCEEKHSLRNPIDILVANSDEEEVCPILGAPPRSKLKTSSDISSCEEKHSLCNPIDILVANSDKMIRHIERLRREASSLSDKYEKEKKRAITAETLLATERSINAQMQEQLIAMRRR